MVGDLLQPTHLLFVLVVALLVLGPKRLPEVGRALGRGLRDFRHAMSGEELPEQAIPPATGTGASPANAPVDSVSEPMVRPTSASTEDQAPASTEDQAPAPTADQAESAEPVGAATVNAETQSKT
jgi:sec-independent protein translocase protein TatA